ncbi:TPA: hypothetical protein ACX3KE_003874, partial [Enterobacter kobei]
SESTKPHPANLMLRDTVQCFQIRAVHLLKRNSRHSFGMDAKEDKQKETEESDNKSGIDGW